MHNAVIHSYGPVRAPSPFKMPLPVRRFGPIYSWTPASLASKQHIGQFICFCTLLCSQIMKYTDAHTDVKTMLRAT